MLEFTWQSLVFAIVNFLILVALLYRFLHKPLLAALEKRKQDIEQAREQAEAKAAEADEARAKHEKELAAIDGERDRVLSEARRNAETASAEMVAKARKDADAEVANVKRDWERQHRDAIESLQEEIVGVSLDLAGRVLQELTGGDVEAALHARLREQLEALAAEDKADARQGLFGGQAPVRVVSARPMPDEARKAVSERIQALSDTPVEIDFDVAEDLIAGARIEFSSMAIDATLAGIVQTTRERFAELTADQDREPEAAKGDENA